MKILITGASGLVGTHLTDYFLKLGHEVAHLGRKKNPENRVKQFRWDIEKNEIDAEAIQWADAVVHLAGANVAEGKWTAKRKVEIINSRVKSTALLLETIRKNKNSIRAIASASAVGWYGMITSEKIFSEEDPAATDFFGECCRLWEAAVDKLESENCRVVKLRIGVVLAKEGGALPKLVRPVKWFVGSPLGSGKQWMPWIHIDDLCALFLKALEDEQMSGSYNAVTSQDATNKMFVKATGKILHRPVFLPPVPEFLLRLFLGEMAGIVTKGSRVSNEKILRTGFKFRFVELSEALIDLLKS
jgi:uncharacterized protein (TIGR01777 family)